MKIRDLLAWRARPLVTVSCGQSLATARALMQQYQIRHLPVLDGSRLVGLLTERDLLRALTEVRLSPLDITVESVMTTGVLTLAPEASIQTALHTLNLRRVGCLPVVEQDTLVGIVTTSDLLALAERIGDAAQPQT